MILLKSIYSSLLTTFLFVACTNGQSSIQHNEVGEDAVIITVEEDKIHDRQDISDIIDTIILKELKEDHGQFLGEASKIFRREDQSYIIFDRYNAKRISLIDSIGNRLQSAVTQGRGPNELTQLSDCWLGEDRKSLYVYDHILKRITVFDTDLSTIKRTYQNNTGDIYQNLMSVNDRQFVGYVGYSDYDPLFNEKAYHLFVLDNQLDVTAAELPYNQLLRGAAILTDPMPFQQLDQGKVRFTQVYDNHIYVLDSLGDVHVDYVLQYDQKPFPSDFPKSILENSELLKSNNYTPDQGKDLFSGYYGFLGEWRETKDYIIFSSFNPDILGFRTIYDKRQHKVLKQGMLFEDATKAVLIPNFQGIDYHTNSFLGMYSGAEIMEAFDTKSPFYAMVAQSPESNFLIEIVLK